MLRTAGAVVLGYLVMAILVFALFTSAYAVLGAEGAFMPGSYDVSAAWILVSVVVGIVAALAGGWVARRIARDVRGPRALAVLVLVLGLGMAALSLGGSRPDPGPREGAPTNSEAMQQARTPTWMMLLNPLIGALGVLVGGGALGPSRRLQVADGR
ncbi:MAG TPA: hypothetical protein VGE02_11500 [Gemmatimonadales bacterium]